MKKKCLIIGASILIVLLILLFIFLNPFLNIKLIGDKNINIILNNNYEELGYKATYFKKDITDSVKISGTVDSTKVGTYKIKYTIKKGLTKKSITRVIHIIDTSAPVISLTDGDIKVCPGEDYVEPGYSAIDEYDGDITSKVEVIKEENTIIYKSIDSSGNEAILKRNLSYEDTKSPEITLNGNSSITLKVGSSYKEEGATAIDNCDGDLTNKISISGTVNTNKVGTYEIKYTVSDRHNNESSKLRTIKITNNTITGYENSIDGPTYIKGILIVNKKYSIPSSFGGNDTTATAALNRLQAGAKEAGYSATLVSGYRSYSTQQSIYNSYIKRWGQEYTDQVSARPGHSEHQTGLAFDVGVLTKDYANTPEGKWVTENCYKYGFIIRYPKGKENITGYNYEPWHIRYVGVDAATYIMNHNITLEEYLGVV